MWVHGYDSIEGHLGVPRDATLVECHRIDPITVGVITHQYEWIGVVDLIQQLDGLLHGVEPWLRYNMIMISITISIDVDPLVCIITRIRNQVLLYDDTRLSPRLAAM